jgi:hypothetical protein
MMRTVRPAFLILIYLGLIVYAGSTTFTIAGQTDVPHQAHMAFLRGPGMGGDASACPNCHTSGSPGQGDIDLDACDTCHSSGGPFDGVNDPSIGALNNWHNFGSDDPATKSLIYGVGGLKPGKEKWCVGCHDGFASSSGEVVYAVDDFEGYASDSELSSVWIKRQDANSVKLAATSVPDVQGSESMEVDVWWENSDKTYGTASRDYSPALDLDAADSVGFWLRVESTTRFSDVRIKMRIAGTSPVVWSIGTVNFDAFNMQAWEWKWIQLSRANFSNNEDWSQFDRIQFRANEDTSTTSHVSFWVDDVKFLSAGSVSDAPDVVGDNQTQGYYVTGHRIDCTYCHDPYSEHIDGQSLSSIYEYFTDTANPTGFRLYSDPGYGLQLPYTEYVPGPGGSFALCYQCHDEGVILEEGDARDIVTNFKDENYLAGGSPDNLHLEHISLTPIVYHITCVMCHDPHGQANPAMVRADVGGFLNFDTSGCEIPLGVDSDGDGTDDRRDPDTNKGGAQKQSPSESYPMCDMVCHTGAAPPNPDCAGSNPYTSTTGSGMDGWYSRSYAYVPHDENMDVGPICLTAGCHPVGPLHAAHFESGPPFYLNESGCDECHDKGTTQCQETPLFADHEYFADTTVCDACHSGGGP